MWEDDIAARLAALRETKGVSARDMSLSIGQNAGYIKGIENGRALPSMSAFLFICEFLGITPAEFFDVENSDPALLCELISDLKKLDGAELRSIAEIVKRLSNK
ncbi:MAG: helix-turn-helix transcriptional regulator [Oscillospiraceae bacterium]|nr:helix-turn-helix transcriptional regulator [Oscillospiraceae bacterium]